MARHNLLKITVAGLALFFMCRAAQAQGSVSIMDKLTRLEERLNQLDAAQKKETKELYSQLKEIQTGADPVLTDSLKTLQMEMALLESNVEALKGDSNQDEAMNLLKSIAADMRVLLSAVNDSAKRVTAPKQEIKTPPPEAKPSSGEVATGKFKIKFFGFARLEAIYDKAEVNQGDWLLYAYSGGSPQSKRQIYTMTARHSRIDMKFDGPSLDNKGEISALFEADFSGGFTNSSTAARQPLMVLRHYWVELKYPRWESRFGQDWALISSPFPNTTSYVVGAGVGNLWMRIPQISFTWKPNPVKVAVSINRPMSGNIKYNEFDNGDLDPIQDGERTGIPWFMTRCWLKTGPATFSVSGHWGHEDVADLKNNVHREDSYSLNADGVVTSGPVSVTLRGFYGENLNTFFGGVFQGFSRRDSISVTNVISKGGWGQVVYTFNDTWATTIGAGVDAPYKSRLTNNMKSQNGWGWANVAYTVKKALTFMLEGEYLNTHYLGGNTGENTRVQFVSTYKF